jgi:hypothetical protein
MLELVMDQEVTALRRLLQATAEHPAGTPERRRFVAERAGCSADNLYQVAKGILLDSGKPRGVGRELRQRLDAAFPHWLDAIASVNEPSPAYAVPDLAEQLAHAISALSLTRWISVRAQLDSLPGRPDILDQVVPELRHLLLGPDRSKRSGTHG